MRLTLILLTVSLMTAACEKAGDFCDVVPGPLLFERPVSEAMVQKNRREAEAIAVQNRYGRKFCDWAQ